MLNKDGSSPKNNLGSLLLNKISAKIANDVYDNMDANEEEIMIKMGYTRDSEGRLVNQDGQHINIEGKFVDENGVCLEPSSNELE